MGWITSILKVSLIILFGFTAIGMLLYSIWIFPDPGAFVFGGTAIIVLLMLWAAWAISPPPSPGW